MFKGMLMKNNLKYNKIIYISKKFEGSMISNYRIKHIYRRNDCER